METAELHNPWLMDEYVYATECNLATLDTLCMRKGSSKSDIRRQTSICARMLRVCQSFPDAHSIHSRHSTRVGKLILKAREADGTSNINEKIDAVVGLRAQELRK